MILIGGLIIAAVAIALALIVWAIKATPMGWEDENGFHRGEPDEGKDG